MLKLLSKRTANDIVIEIHNEIDTAQDRLLQQANDIISYRQPLDNQKAERLAAIGFVNTIPVLTHLENKSILVKTNEHMKTAKMTFGSVKDSDGWMELAHTLKFGDVIHRQMMKLS